MEADTVFVISLFFLVAGWITKNILGIDVIELIEELQIAVKVILVALGIVSIVVFIDFMVSALISFIVGISIQKWLRTLGDVVSGKPQL